MDTTQVKSFWQRPEGTTGKILVGLMIALASVGFIHFNVMGILAQLAADTFKLMISLCGIAFVGMVVTAKRPRTLLFYALQSLSRAITRNFVEIDPVGILRAFVKDMETKRQTVKKATESMMMVRQKATQQRNLKEKEMMDALKLAEAAQQIGNVEKFKETTERAGRRQARIGQLDENITFANDSIQTLQRVDRVIEYHINNATDEADDLESDNELAIQMLAASHAANEALGDSDKLDVRDMARDVIIDKTAKAKASVEALMENTRSMQGDMDLNNIALMQDGMRKLQQLREGVGKEEQAALLSGGKKPLQATARVLTNGAQDGTVNATNRWANRLNK
jgi:hypothetical protein